MGLVGRGLERIRLNFWCNTNLEPSGRYHIENTGCMARTLGTGCSRELGGADESHYSD
jgi:hypothetical protein